MNERSEPGTSEGGRRATTRRSLLGALAVAGTAGCLGLGGEETEAEPAAGGFQTVGADGGPEPTETPTATATPTATPTATATPAPETPTPGSTPDGVGDGGSVSTAVDTAGDAWESVDDPYYSGLQDDLAAMGLPPGEFVYANSEAGALSKFQVWSNAAETSSVPVDDDQPFSAARRVRVTEDVENPWDVTMNGPVNSRSVSEGDVLLGVVYLRGPVSSPKDPTIQFVAKDQDNEVSNMVTGKMTVNPPTEWTRYYVPMQWSYDSEAGTWWWELFHGFGVQTTDVGGIALVDFDRSAKVENLPSGAVV